MTAIMTLYVVMTASLCFRLRLPTYPIDNTSTVCVVLMLILSSLYTQQEQVV